MLIDELYSASSISFLRWRQKCVSACWGAFVTFIGSCVYTYIQASEGRLCYGAIETSLIITRQGSRLTRKCHYWLTTSSRRELETFSAVSSSDTEPQRAGDVFSCFVKWHWAAGSGRRFQLFRQVTLSRRDLEKFSAVSSSDTELLKMFANRERIFRH